uniref:Putative helicase n=2 Tax=viral metagenome TaxID=1070528 RepID=A0A6H2A1V1_9ZZZZ
MTIPDSPRAIGVPHDAWHHYQKSAIEYILDSDKRYVLAEGHTGVGKSACVSAQAYRWEKVTVLTASHSLADQYHDPYGFTIIKGRDNYLCAYRNNKFSCDYCSFSPATNCKVLGECEYHRAKMAGLRAQRTVTNYYYGWWSRTLKQREGLLACDEAHLLENVVLDIVGVEVTERQAKRFDLPPFPSILGATVRQGTTFHKELERWLKASYDTLRPQSKEPTDGEIITPDERAANNLLKKISSLGLALKGGEEWFVKSGSIVRKTKYGVEGGMSCKPLEPGNFVNNLFSSFSKILLVSATLGDPESLCEILGIPEGEWDYDSFSNPSFVSDNPIRIVPCPAMTAKAGNKDYEIQADAIARVIKRQKPTDRGIVFTTSWHRVKEMAKRLGERGLSSRIYVPERGKTNDQVNGYLDDKSRGLIAVVPIFSWGHGLDLTPDKCNFSVLAKTPWMDWGDEYVQARAKREGGKRWYDRWAALLGVQAVFRVREGNRYICDASWGKVHKYSPRWVRLEGE